MTTTHVDVLQSKINKVIYNDSSKLTPTVFLFISQQLYNV